MYPASTIEENVRLSPEKLMLCSMLSRALLDLEAIEGGKTKYKKDAIEWLHAGRPLVKSDRCITFHEVCEGLDLDPSSVLKRLTELGFFDG